MLPLSAWLWALITLPLGLSFRRGYAVLIVVVVVVVLQVIDSPLELSCPKG